MADVLEAGRDFVELLTGLVPRAGLSVPGSNGAAPNIFSSRRTYFFCPSNNSLESNYRYLLNFDAKLMI